MKNSRPLPFGSSQTSRSAQSRRGLGLVPSVCSHRLGWLPKAHALKSVFFDRDSTLPSAVTTPRGVLDLSRTMESTLDAWESMYDDYEEDWGMMARLTAANNYHAEADEPAAITTPRSSHAGQRQCEDEARLRGCEDAMTIRLLREPAQSSRERLHWELAQSSQERLLREITALLPQHIATAASWQLALANAEEANDISTLRDTSERGRHTVDEALLRAQQLRDEVHEDLSSRERLLREHATAARRPPPPPVLTTEPTAGSWYDVDAAALGAAAARTVARANRFGILPSSVDR